MKCSFCGSKREDVGVLVSGPNVHICDKCVLICVDVIFQRFYPPKVPTPMWHITRLGNGVHSHLSTPDNPRALCGVVAKGDAPFWIEGPGGEPKCQKCERKA